MQGPRGAGGGRAGQEQCACACVWAHARSASPGLWSAAGRWVPTSPAAVGRCRAGGSWGPCPSSQGQGPVWEGSPCAPHIPAAVPGGRWGSWLRRGGSGAGAGHRHARCAPSTPGPAWAGRAPRGSALSCLWREEASPDIPQRAAVGRWGLSGSRLAWPTPSGARGARPVPEEPPGEVSGQGTAERRCNGPRPGLAPRLRAGRGRLRWPGAPTLGVEAAGRTCPVGPAWAAASASARPGMSLFLRVAAPLLPCCRLGAVFGVGSETPVGCGEVAPQSDTAPGSRGGAGPSGKAAWLSPALGPSVVVSGHGARTGGRLTHRPRSWVSKQVARRAPQTQQVRRAGRVTAGRLSVAASCGAEAVGAGAAGQAGLGAAVSRSRGSQPCPGGRPREPCQAPSPGAGPWAGELARAPRPTEHREQCRVCLQLTAWKLGTHRARCFQGPLAPWPPESLL